MPGEYSAKEYNQLKIDADYHRAKLEILFTSARQASSPFVVISIVCIGEPLPPMDFALLIVT